MGRKNKSFAREFRRETFESSSFEFFIPRGKMNRGRQNAVEIRLLFISQHFRVACGDNAEYFSRSTPPAFA